MVRHNIVRPVAEYHPDPSNPERSLFVGRFSLRHRNSETSQQQALAIAKRITPYIQTENENPQRRRLMEPEHLAPHLLRVSGYAIAYTGVGGNGAVDPASILAFSFLERAQTRREIMQEQLRKRQMREGPQAYIFGQFGVTWSRDLRGEVDELANWRLWGCAALMAVEVDKLPKNSYVIIPPVPHDTRDGYFFKEHAGCELAEPERPWHEDGVYWGVAGAIHDRLLAKHSFLSPGQPGPAAPESA